MCSRYAVNLDLKGPNFTSSLMFFGRLLNSLGAETVKKLSLSDWNLAFVPWMMGGMFTNNPLLALRFVVMLRSLATLWYIILCRWRILYLSLLLWRNISFSEAILSY